MNLYRPVEPVSPVAPYVGGNRNLAKVITKRIEAIKHTTYVEPFVGMGGIFLKRRFATKWEVINDWGREAANFFRILQVHYIPFMALMRFQITADFTALADILSGISGRFTMSLNGRPEGHDTLKSFHIKGVKTAYTIGKKGTKKMGEVIISS